MAIEKKLICFARLEEFERQLAAGNILGRSIVFIQDAKKIWTRGTYYNCNSDIKQDILVSGTNIKTINGQSLLGAGDITIEGGSADNVYITDFTVNDLENTIGSGLDVVADLTSLEEALAAHKVILVPYNADDGYLGYGFLTGYAEDLLYCTVYVGFDGLFYEIEATRGDTAIRGQSIFKRTWSDKQDRLVSGTNIKTINGTSILGSGNIEIEGGETLTESDIAAMGFTKNTGTYSKPSGGIPSSDLDTATQNILQAADENHELIQDFNVDIAQLQDNKQDKLVSGTNIKTINGESIVGSGNIIISGGSSSGAYSEVNHGTSDTTFTLTPNTFHVWDEVASLTLDFGSETSGVANEFLFQFTSGATATSLTLPDDIKWANDSAPTIVENMIYQVSVLKGLASVLEFSNEVPSVPIVFYVNGTPYDAMSNMTWNDFINSDYNPDIYNDKMFITGSYGSPKYALYIYAEDDIEYSTIMFEGYGEVLLTDKILPTNYIAE